MPQRRQKGKTIMLKKQLNRFAMFEAVHTYLKENESAFAGTAELTEAMNKLKNMVYSIIELDDMKTNVTKGTTSLKRETQEEAVSAATALAGALYAFAKKSKNVTLADKTSVTFSTLNNMRDIEFVLFLNSIRELAINNLQQLANFGITEEKFEEYKLKFARYYEALNARESSRATRISASRVIAEQFRETDELLKSLDRLVEAFRKENKQFFNGYIAVRNVHDLGSRHRKLPDTPGNIAAPQS
jgi:hypothetical protein